MTRYLPCPTQDRYHHDVTPTIAALLIAPFIGSFLGVLILRLPADAPIAWSRSRCDSCGHTLAPRDLVPLLSHLLLRGRCRTCHAAIPALHWQVEIAALLVALWAVTVDDDPLTLWANCALGWTLLTLAWIDLRTLLLPDILTLPLIVAGLALTALDSPDNLADHALAAALAWAALAGLAAAYRHLRGHDGLGGGDAKLLAAAGAWLGLTPLPWIIAGAATLTLAITLTHHHQHSQTTPLPLGPALALAIWLGRLYGGGG